MATDYLCLGGLFDYFGVRHPTARLAYPRVGACRRDGSIIPDNVVPWELPEAMAILAPRAVAALRLGESLLPPAERGNAIRSESGAGFSVTYRDDAPSYTVQTDVVAFLANLVRRPMDAGRIELGFVARSDNPDTNPVLLESSYRNPGAIRPQ